MPWWSDWPWYLVQANLRNSDFIDLDPSRFAQDFSDLGATVALLNVGGITAHYQSQIPYQVMNPYVRDAHVIKALIAELHQRSIKVLARVDFSKVPISVGIENPSWLYRDKDQQLMQYNGFYQTCILGEYQQVHALTILKEIFDTFAFDGLYCNMMGFQSRDYSHRDWGHCHCAACRAAFSRYRSEDIPVEASIDDPVYHTYLRFTSDQEALHRAKIAALLDGYGERKICFDGRDYDRREAAGELNRRPMEFMYHSSSNCRTRINGRIVSNAMVDFPGYARRHCAVSPHIARLRFLQTISNGGALDYYQIGRLDNRIDRTCHETVKEVFALKKRHEHVLQGMVMEAQVLLRRNNGWTYTAEEQGWITVLSENHILFEEATCEKLQQLDLCAYDLLILPDSWNLSLREATLIDAYVEQGGRIIATGGSALYDEESGLRSTPLLRSLGVQRVQGRSSCDQSALYWITAAEKNQYFPRMGCADVVPVGELCYTIKLASGAKRALALIPDHTYGPPEWCAFDAISLEAGMVISSYGQGKTLYLPWKMAHTYFLEGSGAIQTMMEDLLLGWASLVSIAPSAPSCVEMSMGRTDDGRQILFLINLSGVHYPTPSDPLPIRDIMICVETQRSVGAVTSLEGNAVEYTQQDHRVMITVQCLHLWDAIVITYEI